jgi:RING finger/CHY zinc finger protein 1
MSTSTTTSSTTTCGIRTMDRFAITQIICRNCHTKQSSNTNNCITCYIQFADYHCNICNIWMSNTSLPFHCTKCGFCRVGGSDNYKHCDTCCMCLSVTIYNKHDCKPDKYKSSCPVCREDMFSSRQSPVELPCGHAIHVHCFRSLTSYGDSRCPICKKTVVNCEDMIVAWRSRARDIEAQPMPSDLSRIVDVLCNDCEVRSCNRSWHFLGVQCLACLSFNTVVERVVSTATSSRGDVGGGEGL